MLFQLRINNLTCSLFLYSPPCWLLYFYYIFFSLVEIVSNDVLSIIVGDDICLFYSFNLSVFSLVHFISKNHGIFTLLTLNRALYFFCWIMLMSSHSSHTLFAFSIPISTFHVFYVCVFPIFLYVQK